MKAEQENWGDQKEDSKPQSKFVQTCNCLKHFDNVIVEHVISGTDLSQVVELVFQYGEKEESVREEAFKFYKSFLEQYNDCFGTFGAFWH
jgi:hypothetical protein